MLTQYLKHDKRDASLYANIDWTSFLIVLWCTRCFWCIMLNMNIEDLKFWEAGCLLASLQRKSVATAKELFQVKRVWRFTSDIDIENLCLGRLGPGLGRVCRCRGPSELRNSPQSEGVLPTLHTTPEWHREAKDNSHKTFEVSHDYSNSKNLAQVHCWPLKKHHTKPKSFDKNFGWSCYSWNPASRRGEGIVINHPCVSILLHPPNSNNTSSSILRSEKGANWFITKMVWRGV